MDVVLLVDGDILAYKVGFACQKRTWILEGMGVRHEFHSKKELNDFVAQTPPPTADGWNISSVLDVEPESHAFVTCRQMILNAAEAVGADSIEVFLSSTEGCFREALASTAPYKGTRWSLDRVERELTGRWKSWIEANESSIQSQPKPRLHSAIREYLMVNSKWTTFPACGPDALEADDVIGIRSQDERSRYVIASIDKDLQMLPGVHYHLDSKEITEVTPEQAVRNFYSQLLTGDRTDNVTGLPGIGEVTAGKLLDKWKPEEWLENIANLYWTYGCLCNRGELAMSYLNEQATLLWILRSPHRPWHTVPENAYWHKVVKGTANLKQLTGVTLDEEGKLKVAGYLAESLPGAAVGDSPSPRKRKGKRAATGVQDSGENPSVSPSTGDQVGGDVLPKELSGLAEGSPAVFGDAVPTAGGTADAPWHSDGGCPPPDAKTA